MGWGVTGQGRGCISHILLQPNLAGPQQVTEPCSLSLYPGAARLCAPKELQ